MPEPVTPTLVVVSGPPRTGKTTLAHAIGRSIGCPAVSRDEIKEGMVHAQGGEFRAAAGDRLTQKTFPLFFDVLRMLLEAEVTVVAEAAFQDGLWRHGLEPMAALARLRIVQCHADPALGRQRRRMAADATGAAAHARIIGAEVEDCRQAHASFQHLSLAAPSIDVDTSVGLTPNLEEIVAFVNDGR